ncbi:MAG: serine protease [Alphaproteobacteria bacterium]|nr:MAG: serine protease [Alphaproteobacteria bacterium]
MLTSLLAQSLMLQQGSSPAKAVYEQCRPSVVSIEAKTAKGRATGSGFFYGDGRTVVTALHVVIDATKVVIRDLRGRTWEPVTIAWDAAGDIAILTLAVNSGHKGLTHGPSQEVHVGDDIYVIGDPLGLEATLSTGIVSALRKEEDVPYVQISAPISHGSSGGPVLDRRGRVIGIVDAFEKDGQNLNIAISSQVAKWIQARNDAILFSRFVEIVSEASQEGSSGYESKRSSTDNPRSTDGDSSSNSAEKIKTELRVKLAAFFSDILTRVFIASDRWILAWDSNQPTDATGRKRLTPCYEELTEYLNMAEKFVLEDLANELEQAGLDSTYRKELQASFNSFQRVCEEAHEAENAWYLRSRSDEEANSRLWESQASQRVRRMQALGEFRDALTAGGVEFRNQCFGEMPPAIYCSSFLKFFLGFPDYDLQSEVLVRAGRSSYKLQNGALEPGSPLRTGDRIVGVAIRGDATFLAVASWKDLKTFVTTRWTTNKYKDAIIRVKRGGGLVDIDQL